MTWLTRSLLISRGLWEFTKATLIGGVFILVPVMLVVYLVGEALGFAYRTIQPLMRHLPFSTVRGNSLAFLVAIGVVVAICFVAGLLAKTRLAQWLVAKIESAILSNLPGYSLIKAMGEGMVGLDSPSGRKAVLVRFIDRQQVGIVMDETGGAGPTDELVVFVPNVPSPWTGTLHVVPRSQTEPIPVPLRETIESLQKLGIGLSRVLARPQEKTTSDTTEVVAPLLSSQGDAR